MRSLILTLILMFSVNVFAIKTITLDKQDNLIVLEGGVSSVMSSEFTKRVLSDQKEFIVYINSRGGEATAMNNIIEHIKYSGKKFTCIAKFAASAAFMILQHCDKRYMLPHSGILMSHNGIVNISGDEKTVRGILKMFDALSLPIDKTIAKRMKISYEEYQNLIAKDLWLDYTLAKKHNAIDDEVYVTCSKTLIKEKVNAKFCSQYGCEEKEVSACPLIR